jgi:hypothetical protein
VWKVSRKISFKGIQPLLIQLLIEKKQVMGVHMPAVCPVGDLLGGNGPGQSVLGCYLAKDLQIGLFFKYFFLF